MESFHSACAKGALSRHRGCRQGSRHGYIKKATPFAVYIAAFTTTGGVDGFSEAGAAMHGVCDRYVSTETTQREPEVSYQAEKFATARRALMLPHTRGEHEAIANAFHECSLGLHNIDSAQFDDNARAWIQALERFMDTSGYSDSSGQGLWSIKAQGFTVDDKLEISRIIDELADWFASRS
jgi:hypothetical protein